MSPFNSQMCNVKSVDVKLSCLYRWLNKFVNELGVYAITDPKKILASNLRRIRNSTGMSQEELADRAGLHRTYISSVERAQRNVTLENIFALAKALGVQPDQLIKPIPKGDE